MNAPAPLAALPFASGARIAEIAAPLGDPARNYIAPGNDEAMQSPDTLGRERHWILEIHLIDKSRSYGGFYERLL